MRSGCWTGDIFLLAGFNNFQILLRFFILGLSALGLESDVPGLLMVLFREEERPEVFFPLSCFPVRMGISDMVPKNGHLASDAILAA
jgi:hypothetical protein